MLGRAPGLRQAGLRRAGAKDAGATFTGLPAPVNPSDAVPKSYVDTLAAGLENYRARRVLRTARVQLMSRAMGDHVYHPAGLHASLRNELMSRKSQAQWLETLDWLYGGNGLD